MNNGSAILRAPLTEAQTACVDLLKEALAEALQGNITSIAIIACMTSGYASVMAGTQAGDLNLGCDSLKRKILDEIEGGNIARRKKSSIVPVRG
jgi:hypothetical protein